tara:strand:+ start:875 stop:1111 length:237 start_codon:yes stop_codon:yes gene_type:complete
MKKTILLTLIGGAVGYGYYYFIGCDGTCSITNSSMNSIAYGALVGLGDWFSYSAQYQKFAKKITNNQYKFRLSKLCNL